MSTTATAARRRQSRISAIAATTIALATAGCGFQPEECWNRCGNDGFCRESCKMEHGSIEKKGGFGYEVCN